jgi:hypothetical protein
MQCSDLFEAVRANVLYHATTVDGLYEMLEDDEIKPNTGHPITHTGGEKRSAQWAIRPKDVNQNGYLKGVSLTRNIIFARAWKSDGVILVLNGDMIKRDFRILPISFFGSRREIADEAEEFIPGSMKPLSRYLIHIETNQRVMTRNPMLGEIGSLFPSAPKLIVNGLEWRKVGLNKGTIVKSKIDPSSPIGI